MASSGELVPGREVRVREVQSKYLCRPAAGRPDAPAYTRGGIRKRARSRSIAGRAADCRHVDVYGPKSLHICVYQSRDTAQHLPRSGTVKARTSWVGVQTCNELTPRAAVVNRPDGKDSVDHHLSRRLTLDPNRPCGATRAPYLKIEWRFDQRSGSTISGRLESTTWRWWTRPAPVGTVGQSVSTSARRSRRILQ